MIETATEEKVVLKDISDTTILKHLGYTAADINALIPRPVDGRDGFYPRLNRGIFAEKFFIHAIENGDIFDKQVEAQWLDAGIRREMTWDEKEPLIVKNAVHGDCRFRFKGEYEVWRHVDVKMSSIIMESSLSRFRVKYYNDGWYMMNALSLTTNNYYMVRNNEDFRRAVRETGLPERYAGSNDIAYNIMFDKLNKVKYPCLEFLEMDPVNYRKMVNTVRREIQECVEPSLKRIDNLIKKVA